MKNSKRHTFLQMSLMSNFGHHTTILHSKKCQNSFQKQSLNSKTWVTSNVCLKIFPAGVHDTQQVGKRRYQLMHLSLCGSWQCPGVQWLSALSFPFNPTEQRRNMAGGFSESATWLGCIITLKAPTWPSSTGECREERGEWLHLGPPHPLPPPPPPPLPHWSTMHSQHSTAVCL